MAEIFKATYDEMTTMASRLDDGRDSIGSILTTLKAQVDTLLGEDFRTQHASEKFGEGYTKMTTGLDKALDGLNDMASNLRKMVDGIQELDQKLSGN